MRWIPNLGRNLVPILLGISLTTVTCVSLAIFCKSLFEKDDNEKDTKKSARIIRSKCIKVQRKVPKKFIAAIIGRGGSVIKDIQAKTGTYIKVNDENIESSDCVCIIQGTEIESIRLAESIIENIIDNQPVIETFELFVPYEAWTKYMISNRGSVRNIQLTTGAKVIVESEPHKAGTGLQRKLILKGTDNQIAHTISYINNVLPSIQDDEKISSKTNSFKSTEDSSFFSDNVLEDMVDTESIEIVYMPCEVYKAIAGIEEDTMEQIRRSSGAKVILQENEDDLPSEKIIISGTNDQIAAAVNQICQRSEEISKIRKYLEHEFTAETVLRSILFYGNNFKNIRDDQSASKIYKILMSHEINKEIVERNGKIIQEWQNYSGAKITLENDPHKSEDGTRETRYTITGTNIQILTAIEQIANKYPNEIQVPDVKDGEQITDNRDIKIYEMSVPLVSCKRIEDNLRKIQQFSEAQVMMESDSQNCERKITITGNIDQIAQAVLWIKDKVREEYQYQSELKKDMNIPIKMPNSKRITDKDGNTSNNVLKFPSSKDDLIEVIVSTSQTPNQFWIHRVNSENNASSQLLEEITEYYDKQENRELHVLKKVLPGQMVAAKRCNDKWYRAKVISIVNGNECEVLFVDSGHLEKISTNDLLELRTDMLCIRVQATECSLANVKPRESEWNFDACKKFDELVNVSQSKCLLAKIRNYKKCLDRFGFNHEVVIPCLDLYNKIDDEYVNVGDTLVSLEFAQYEEKLCSMTNSMLSCSE